MSRPKCPSCKQDLVPAPDLFGEKRWRHPETECAEPPRFTTRQGVVAVERKCKNCNARFISRIHRNFSRVTCSEDCRRDLSTKHLLANHYPTHNPKPAESPARQRMRKRWQEKAAKQDKEWAA